MKDIQENITSVQKHAIMKKVTEYDNITLERIQNLKVFSAELDDVVWHLLSSDDVSSSITTVSKSQDLLMLSPSLSDNKADKCL